MTQQLWALVGATGTGKTALSLDLAEALAAAGRRAEIVNADAMQLFRGMDIGTAKLPDDERRGIPHHLFDALDITNAPTVAALEAGKVPVSHEHYQPTGSDKTKRDNLKPWRRLG